MSINIAIVGATGLVGKTLLQILAQRNFPVANLFLLASKESSGQILSFRDKDYSIISLAEFSWQAQKVDIAFFSAGNDISLHYAPIARDSGCVVIDNSSAYRYDDAVPLIVPEINRDVLFEKNLCHQAKSGAGVTPRSLLPACIIANPNCSTIQMLLALAPIHAAVGIRKIFVSTYQSVSGAGQSLIDILLENESTSSSIHANLIPQIDDLQENAYSREEMKIVWESRKILNAPDLLLSATAVRVPVINAHSESVIIETAQAFSVKQAIQCLEKHPELIVLKDHWITPKEVSGRNEVFVSRIRQDLVFGEKGLSMWIVADNLRKGAALNAVQIAELFL